MGASCKTEDLDGAWQAVAVDPDTIKAVGAWAYSSSPGVSVTVCADGVAAPASESVKVTTLVPSTTEWQRVVAGVSSFPGIAAQVKCLFHCSRVSKQPTYNTYWVSGRN